MTGHFRYKEPSGLQAALVKRQTMLPKLNAALLAVVMLASLMDSALGAPTELPTDAPSGEGDEGGSDLLSKNPVWKSLLDATKQHKEEFEKEFLDSTLYLHLHDFSIASFPEDCQNTSLNMEACLRRLVHGLLVYQVLLKHVEREYPASKVLANAKYFSSLLINVTRQKMRKPGAVKALSSSQEETLLKEVISPDTFHRKMFAHNILRKLHEFLRDIQIAIKLREKRPRYIFSV